MRNLTLFFGCFFAWVYVYLTVNTKADLRFDFMKADFIPDWVKENMLEKVSSCKREQNVSSRCRSRGKLSAVSHVWMFVIKESVFCNRRKTKSTMRDISSSTPAGIGPKSKAPANPQALTWPTVNSFYISRLFARLPSECMMNVYMEAPLRWERRPNPKYIIKWLHRKK